jgi:uncharacterized cupredoxin-like copper-binding protein
MGVTGLQHHTGGINLTMRNKKIARMLTLLALAVLGGALLLGTACSDDDDDGASPEDLAAVEDIFKQTAEGDESDADFVLEHLTDNMIETTFFSTREDCAANADECIGEGSTVESISGTEIDGDSATLTAVLDFGTFEVAMVREDDVWKVDSIQAASDEVAEGIPLVDLGLGEFVFGLDDTTIPSDGNFAFHVNNAGAQNHEVIVFPIPEGMTLEELMESEEGPEPVGFKVFITPGQTVDMTFVEPLAAGNYALVCFFPDTSSEEMTEHAELGMVKEFTVG